MFHVSVLGLLFTMSGTTAQQAALPERGELQHCDRPFGTLALAEPRAEYRQHFTSFGLGSPTSLLRMMAQQSNCFVVVERGAGMDVMRGERELGSEGDARSGSNMGKGQMVVADFVLSPTLQVMDSNAGGGGLLGGVRIPRLPLVSGGVKVKEASTTILISDVRTGVQVASAEGRARKADFSLGLLGWAGSVVGAVGAYTRTAEGKVIAASYLDNFNSVVQQLRENPTMMARAQKFDAAKVTAGEPAAGAGFNEGDVLATKIAVKLLASAQDGAPSVVQLAKNEEVVYLGVEKDGFLKVQANAGEGWVKRAMVVRR